MSAWSVLITLLAVSGAASVQPSGKYPLQLVYQFGDGHWIENMGIRSNGHILATDLDRGLVYDLDPSARNVEPQVVAVLPTGSTPTGVTEVEPDVFYLGNTMGNASALTFQAGTSTIWRLDMNSYNKGAGAKFNKIVDIPEAKMLNGIVTVNTKAGIILVTDSVGGTIYSVNVFTKRPHLALDHPLLKPDPSQKPSFGVNGIRIRGSSLYFANTNYGYLGTFPISLQTGTITPTPHLITSNVFAADDFDIDNSGNIWLAENVQNTLVRVKPSGQIDVIAGGQNSSALFGPVTARFERCPEKRILYVSTDGLSFDDQFDVLTTAGKIVKIDTQKY